jgi:hypothetical protein
MTKSGKRYVRYIICFKEKVVREVSEPNLAIMIS